MNKAQLFAEYPPEMRAQLLADNASDIREGYLMRHDFTPDEMASLREQYSEIAMSKDDIEQEAKVIAQQYKAKITDKKTELKDLSKSIRQRYSEVKGTAYFLPDQKEGKMYIYDSLGNLVEERRLRPEEKQADIFEINRKAINQ